MAHRYESWFPHDTKAHSDPKLQAVVFEFGWEGVGWFWDILARLREAPGHRIEWGRPYIQSSLAFIYRTPVERLMVFVQRLTNDFDLLVLENGFLWSRGMDRNMEELDSKRNQRVEAGRVSGEKRRERAKQPNGRSTPVERPLNEPAASVEQIRIDKNRIEDTLGGKAKKEKSDPVFLKLLTAEELANQEFVKNWTRWAGGRKTKLRESVAEVRLEDCRKWGIVRAIVALHHSTGYDGIFEPNGNQNNGYKAAQPKFSGHTEESIARIFATNSTAPPGSPT